VIILLAAVAIGGMLVLIVLALYVAAL